jgi:hypothetical protein
MTRSTDENEPDPVPSQPETGKVGWALAWLLGVPLPLLLVIYLATRAC